MKCRLETRSQSNMLLRNRRAVARNKGLRGSFERAWRLVRQSTSASGGLVKLCLITSGSTGVVPRAR